MCDKIKKAFGLVIFEFLSAWIITFSVIPGFNNIGHLFYQVAVTAIIIWAFLIVADSEKITPVTVSHSLIIMTVYWVMTAVVNQIKLHKVQNDKSFKWLFLFYYDRPALLIVAFSAVALFFAVKLILKNDNNKYVAQYKKFQKTTMISFLVYYFLVMFYCFFLVRGLGGDPSKNPLNLIPFKVFEGMKAADYEYELIFLFVGNIAIFLPFGVLIPALLKNRLKFLKYAFPFIISIGIEIIQFVLKNGQPDIDDVILNVIGYYIGFAVKILLDRIIKKYSNGKFDSVFIA